MSSNESSSHQTVEPAKQPSACGSSPRSYVKVFSASGRVENIPLEVDARAISSISVENRTTIFINDLRGGDKVDTLLRNYTLLHTEHYLLGGYVRVIIMVGVQLGVDQYSVTYKSSDVRIAKSQVRTLISSMDGRVTGECDVLPFVVADVPYKDLSKIAESENVAHIFLDKRYHVCLDESVPLIKPPDEWNKIETYFGYSINGSSIRMGILDTGIDKSHPDLDDLDDDPNTYDPKVIAEKCFTNEGHTWDGYGHGTHCASIAAGTGEASNHTYVGVAPAAFLLNGKVLDDYGGGSDSWVISGIEWAVNSSADVLSMSFSANINGDGTDPLSMAVDWATDQGVTCVVSAGNAGYGGMFTVGIPAVSREAITVGATTKADEIIYFSSQGPTSDYRLKPDVCAPGVDIVAARANGTSMGTPINGYYTSSSGTSMSTPHVAGAAALILQAHPDWNPPMVKSALMGKARTLVNEHVWRQGAGRVDVCGTVNTTLLIVEPSSSFGLLSIGEVLNTTLTLMNVGNASTSINVSTTTFCDGNETDYVSTNATSLAIPAYHNASISLQAGPLDDKAQEGWYEGWLNVSSLQGYAKAPYLFGAMSTITAYVYDRDDATRIYATMVLATYPNMTFVDSAETPRANAQHGGARFFTTSGEYAICAQMGWVDDGSWPWDYSRAFMLQKVVSVPKFSAMNVSISLADARTNHIPTVDTSGENLTVHAYTQYLSGGPQLQKYDAPFYSSQWSLGSGWFGFDLNVSYLTFYSTIYTPPDKMCEALGYYASDKQHSEVYLLPFKFWNASAMPDEIAYPINDLAKYSVFYDMPETYPENGLNILNAFWFTWDHMGDLQGWGWDVHSVGAGINATYYLAPEVATYFGTYMPTYEGWDRYEWGPLEEWSIGRHYPYPQIPLEKGETGSMVLGRFSFAPYQPGLNLTVSSLGTGYLVNLTGDIWANLSWPHWQWYMGYPLHGPESPYPQCYAKYRVYVDGTLFDEGDLNGKKGYMGEPYINYPPDFLDVDWCGISETWNINGGNVLLQLTLPSMATISRQTIYNMSFNLGEGDSTPPTITGLSHLLNYAPGEDFQINFTMSDIGYGVKSRFLKCSFDNGTTWQDATFQESSYVIPCIEADSLAVLINVTDNAGNSLQYISSPIALCRKVRLDAPEKIIASPGELLNVSGSLTSVEGKGLEGIAVSLSNEETTYAATDENGTFTLALTAPNVVGNYTYKIASPSVGVYSSEEASIILQVRNPPTSPTVISPSGGEIWGGTHNITWIASTDPYGDPLTYEVEYSNDGGKTWNPLASGISTTYHPWNTTTYPDSANYLIRVRAYDGNLYSGWDQSDSAFTIDNAAPIVVITYPTEGGFISGGTVWVNGTVTEPNKGALQPRINDTAFSLASWDPLMEAFAFKNDTAIPDGEISIAVSFTDLAGNTGTGTVLFTLDTTAPIVEITCPSEGEYVSAQALWVNGTVTELNKGALQPSINDTRFSLVYWGSAFAFRKVSYIPPGPLTVTVSFTDLAGNTGSDTVSFIVRRRGWIFHKTTGKHAMKISATDTDAYAFGDTRLKFSETAFQGLEGSPLEWTLEMILWEQPDHLIVGGPPWLIACSKTWSRQALNGIT